MYVNVSNNFYTSYSLHQLSIHKMKQRLFQLINVIVTNKESFIKLTELKPISLYI